MSKVIVRIALFLVFNLFLSSISAQNKVDTVLEELNGNHFFKVSNPSNHRLIIFLHGGVANPYFKNQVDEIGLSSLIEHNTNFINQFSKNEFDLIFPITNDRLNWLNEPKEAFEILKEYINLRGKLYEEIYISGFSDGGTGSFKIFYSHPNFFKGLILFNGYPHHSNFNKKVNYSTIHQKKIIFFSTLDDATIPYEFLLSEYCYQKKENANTYFYLTEGDHDFSSYGEGDFQEIIQILDGVIENKKTEVIQGFVKNDTLISMYPFRKKIVRKYNFGEQIYLENQLQLKIYSK